MLCDFGYLRISFCIFRGAFGQKKYAEKSATWYISIVNPSSIGNFIVSIQTNSEVFEASSNYSTFIFLYVVNLFLGRGRSDVIPLIQYENNHNFHLKQMKFYFRITILPWIHFNYHILSIFLFLRANIIPFVCPSESFWVE